MYEKHFFRTHTREAILHVRKTHLAYGSVSVSIVQTVGSGPPCTQNIPGLRFGLGFGFDCTDWGFWTTLHTKHTWPTVRFRFRFRLYRLGVLDHLAHKTYLAYIHSNPNCHVHQTRLAYTCGLQEHNSRLIIFV